MDARTKIMKLFADSAEKFIKLQAGINEETNSYDFERSCMDAIQDFSHSLYQEMTGGEHVSKNDRMRLLTGAGEIRLNKNHPLAVSPGGFKISPYLQGADVQAWQ
jgi:hypothetical protein